MLPVVAPLGTGTVMLVSLQQIEHGVAVIPLNFTVLFCWVAPKLVPVIVTSTPTAPEVGDTLEIMGSTVKLTPLLAPPSIVTTTSPVVAPVGTVTISVVLVPLVTVAGVPLKATIFAASVVEKFVPVILTVDPTAPDVGDRLAIVGVGTTVKLTPLLDRLPTVTTTFPVVAPVGTIAVMLVVPVVELSAPVPLKYTEDSLSEKFVPVITTAVPAGPDVGERLVIVGVGGCTVKVTPLLDSPPTATTTFPVVALVGTVTKRLVVVALITVAAAPSKVTVFDVSVVEKFVPAIVTEEPTEPAFGDKVVIVGPNSGTVKINPLLLTPLANTTTLPVVAPEGTGTTIFVLLALVRVAVVPLNVTVLAATVVPKFVPVMVTEAPTAPEVGDKLVILGAATTVKVFPLLATPATMTTTLPVVAPVGTVTASVVAVALVTVAAVPLKVTVFDVGVVEKFVPVMVTDAPMAPDVGERVVMVGAAARA
jgi:hypothetical protein